MSLLAVHSKSITSRPSVLWRPRVPPLTRYCFRTIASDGNCSPQPNFRAKTQQLEDLFKDIPGDVVIGCEASVFSGRNHELIHAAELKVFDLLEPLLGNERPDDALQLFDFLVDIVLGRFHGGFLCV